MHDPAVKPLLEPLAQRDIRLSSSQIYRLVVARPERARITGVDR